MHRLGHAQREHRLARTARQHHRCAAAASAATTVSGAATTADVLLLSPAAALTATEEGSHHGLRGLPLHHTLGRLRTLGLVEVIIGIGGAASGLTLLQRRRWREGS